MSRRLKDLTGQKFNRLTVIERVENKGEKVCWKCRCDCGNEITVRGSDLKGNLTKSCGCFQKEKASKRATHKLAGTAIYNTWVHIKSRCLNHCDKAYKYYGARGINIYPQWADDFQTFYDYVSQLPHFGEKGYSLDRIDNDGSYEPNNVRWADIRTQLRNTSRNIFVEYNGISIPLIEAAELSGIKYHTLKRRYHRGDIGDRLFRPVV